MNKYNTERLHQSLGYNTPDEIYFNHITNISDMITSGKEKISTLI